MKIEKRLNDLGLTLPEPPSPMAAYVPYAFAGDLLFISGNGSNIAGLEKFVGKVGREYTIEQGYQAARQTGLNLIAQLKRALGDLDRVERIVHLKGFVNCTDDFPDSPKVINGASELMVEVFGEAGRHSRSAIGVCALPAGMPVEIELVAKIKP